MDLELTGDRRTQNQGFPVLWSRGLAKERSRRKLGSWRNFWYGGFGRYEEELANRAGECELLQTPSMANAGRRRRGDASQRRMRQVASSGRRRGGRFRFCGRRATPSRPHSSPELANCLAPSCASSSSSPPPSVRHERHLTLLAFAGRFRESLPMDFKSIAPVAPSPP